MLAREHIEFLIENLAEANVTTLIRLNRHVLVALLVLHNAQLVCILGVPFNLLAESLNFLLIVF